MNSRCGLIYSCFFACAGLLGIGAYVDAATLTVCKQGCEYTLINSAVAAAASGDTISVGKGTFQENVVVTDKNLTITGYSEDYTVIDGGYNGAVLTLTGATPAKSKVTVSNLTILHGSASGIAVSETKLSLKNVILISNISSASGTGNGAGLSAISSIVSISSSIVAHNRAASGLGGGIYASATSTFTINSSDVFDNTAFEGGGLYIDPNSVATLNASTVTSNSAKDGAAAYVGAFRHGAVEEIGFLIVNSSTIVNNSASEYGGALYVPIEDAGGAFNSSLIVGNKAGVQGGAIYFAEDGSVALSKTVFAGNQPDNCFGGLPCP